MAIGSKITSILMMKESERILSMNGSPIN